VFVDDLKRFAGGFVESIEDVFLCFVAAVDSVSSPEASRDDGCNCSLLTDAFIVEDTVVLRFLLAAEEPADDGEDMMQIAFLSQDRHYKDRGLAVSIRGILKAACNNAPRVNDLLLQAYSGSSAAQVLVR
jgi:hypothetical protein